MNKILLCNLLFFAVLVSQGQDISGTVTDQQGKPLPEVMLFVEGKSIKTATDVQGQYHFQDLKAGRYLIVAFFPEYKTASQTVEVNSQPALLHFQLEPLVTELSSVTVEDHRTDELGITWLQSVSGSAIYEAKKTELILVDELIANKGSNVSRQVYARIPGLNIWENDGAGLQLGIGGRGLNPNRTSNFNVRQNGYDISADALGYPESYYTPPVQALEKIEMVRGAAGLQYGTQFGGMLNFDFKEGPEDKKAEVNLSNTIGSYGLFNTFNSVGGTLGKVNYYGFYQYKHSDGWRPNSGLDQQNLFGSATYRFTPFLNVKLEHTHMSYLAQQPGGLTDLEFYQDPRQSKRRRNWFQVGWDLSAMEWNYRLSSSLKFNNRTFHLAANRYAVGNLGRIDRPDVPDENRNLLKDEYHNWGNELRVIYHYPLLGQKSVLLVGNRLYAGETLRKQGEGDASGQPEFTFVNTGFSRNSAYTFPSRNLAFFAENIFNLTEKFSVTPGVRYEYILTRAAGYYIDQQEDLAGNILYREQIDESKRRYRSLALFGLGISYKHSDRLEVYSNFSQNYRAINFNDIRVDNPSLKVDENLQDERGYNADLGIRGAKTEAFRYDVSLFYLSYNDRIGNLLRTEPDPRYSNLVTRTFRYRTNVADAGIFGLEMYAEGSLLKLVRIKSEHIKLTGFLNLAMIHSSYFSNKESSLEGNAVELVPPVNLKTGVTFRYKSFGSSLLYSYVAAHFSDAGNTDNNPPVPTAVEGTIPSYMVTDLSFSYKWKPFTLETGINNLTNEMYFTRRAAGYPGPGIIPSDGRSGYLTVSVTF